MPAPHDGVQLIVVADDFGLHPRINRGVVRLCSVGALRETSLLANGDAYDDAVAAARSTPELGVGVHLNLVEGEPLSGAKNVPSLCGSDGRFLGGYPAFFRRYTSGGVDAKEVERELATQIARVVDSGIAPTHVNGHQHLHLVPGIARIAAHLCRRHDIYSVRAPRPAGALDHLTGLVPRLLKPKALGHTHGAAGSVKAALLASYAGPARRIFFSSGLYTPDEFFGAEIGGRLDLAYLESLCLRLAHRAKRREGAKHRNSAVELMCHPAEGPFHHYAGYDAEGEFDALGHHRFLGALREAGIVVASFDEARRRNHARM